MNGFYRLITGCLLFVAVVYGFGYKNTDADLIKLISYEAAPSDNLSDYEKALSILRGELKQVRV